MSRNITPPLFFCLVLILALTTGACRKKSPQRHSGGSPPQEKPRPATGGPEIKINDISFAGPAGHRPEADFARGLAMDGKGNVQVTGIFEASAKFGSLPVSSGKKGAQSAFVATADAKGKWTVAVAPDGSGSSLGYGIASDSAGNIYYTGAFTNEVDFDGQNINSTGGNDAYLVKATPTGGIVWTTAAEGKDNEIGYSVAVGAGGSPLVVVGSFNSKPGTFGGHDINSLGGTDSFIWRVNPSQLH